MTYIPSRGSNPAVPAKSASHTNSAERIGRLGGFSFRSFFPRGLPAMLCRAAIETFVQSRTRTHALQRAHTNVGNTDLLAAVTEDTGLDAFMVIEDAFAGDASLRLSNKTMDALMHSDTMIEKLNMLRASGIKIRFESDEDAKDHAVEKDFASMIASKLEDREVGLCTQVAPNGAEIFEASKPRPVPRDFAQKPAPKMIILKDHFALSGNKILDELEARIDKAIAAHNPTR